jgi:small subunit ribosomal protein S4e
MLERKFCQTSFSRWSKLWSIHLRLELRSTVAIHTLTEMLTKFSICSIRYPDPLIKVNDTVKIDLATGKITEFIKFDTGVIAMAIGGRNMGRVGVITHRERHDGGFNIVHIKDAIDNSFATRESNVFVIGSEKPWISLPKGKGVKLTIAEERDRRRAHAIAGH